MLQSSKHAACPHSVEKSNINVPGFKFSHKAPSAHGGHTHAKLSDEKEYMLTLFDTCYGHTPEEYNSSISRITLAYYFKYALILFWW